MLHTISWKEFFILLLAADAFYYGWVLLSYFPNGKGLVAWLSGKGGEETKKDPGQEKAARERLAFLEQEGKVVKAKTPEVMAEKIEPGKPVEEKPNAAVKENTTNPPEKKEKQIEPVIAKGEVAIVGKELPPEEDLVWVEEDTEDENAGEVGGGKTTADKTIAGKAVEEAEPKPQEQRDNEALMNFLNEMKKEIFLEIEKGAMAKWGKPDLQYALTKVLNREEYRLVKGSPFEQKINEQISEEVAKSCSIHLDAQELSGLWIR